MSASDLEKVCLAADSMAKASTAEPLGKNPLWHKKDPSFHLPFYIQHVAHDLMEKRGMPESEAIATAIAIIKKWAAGKPSGGEKNLHKDTQAAAAKALAEWNELKSRAKGSK